MAAQSGARHDASDEANEPDVDFFVGGAPKCGLGYELAFVLPAIMWLRLRSGRA